MSIEHSLERVAGVGSPAFANAPSKKSFSGTNSPILACKAFISNRFPVPTCRDAEDLRRPIERPGLPLRDLFRVCIKLPRQPRQCPIAEDCRKRHLRLQVCQVVTVEPPADPSLLFPGALSRPGLAAIALIPLFSFPEPPFCDILVTSFLIAVAQSASVAAVPDSDAGPDCRLRTKPPGWMGK